jgi:GT2 family glycosyltransferase
LGDSVSVRAAGLPTERSRSMDLIEMNRIRSRPSQKANPIDRRWRDRLPPSFDRTIVRCAGTLRAMLRKLLRPPMWTYHQFPPRQPHFPASYIKSIPTKSAPRFAIVTPSFNQGRFIKATIDSVLGQNYPALDYLVKDAGSQDETLATLKSYGADLRWRQETDRGQAHAINDAFRHVDGELMGWLNSDDVLAPHALAAVADYFETHRDVDIVYGHRVFIDASGLEIGRAVLPPHNSKTLRYADYVPQETLFWRRHVWEKLGGLDESFQYALDWDFLLRASAAGFKFARIPRFLACFRIHQRQKTSAWLERGMSEQAVLRARWVHPDWTWTQVNFGISRYMLRQHLYHRAWRLGLLQH